MKIHSALCAAVLLVGCAQPPDGGKNQNSTAAAVGTTASAVGTVDVVDVSAGKITISHGPVDALKWPAMTMAFNATPGQLAAVRPGQKVEFEFVSRDMDATLTRIAATK